GAKATPRGPIDPPAVAGKFVTSLRVFTFHTRTPPNTVAKASHLLSGEKVMLTGRSQKLVVRGAAILCVARSQSRTGWPSASFMVAVASQRPSAEAAAL